MKLSPTNPYICIYTKTGTVYIPTKSWEKLKLKIDDLMKKSKLDPRKDEISGIQIKMLDVEIDDVIL